MNLNLTPTQVVALVISTLSVLAGATAQLTTLFGQTTAQGITTACALGSAILGGWIAVLTGQGNLVRQVAAMPGVERISVNALANQTLAQVAVDPAQGKVEATASAEAAVNKTATGAGA